MADRPALLFLGAFPPPDRQIRGGNVQDCRVALDSEIAETFRLMPVDSTQVSVPPPPIHARVMPALRRLAAVVRIVRTQSPDAMLVFAATGASFFEKSLACAAARLGGVRVLLFVRDGHFMDDCRQRPWFRRVARMLLHIPDYVLCQGPSWREFFTRELGVDASRCPVVENWVATEPLLRIGRARAYERREVLRAVFLGWITRGKGIHELIEAIAQLAREGTPVELHVCGDGPDRELAERAVRDGGCASLVKFHGWIDDAGRLERLREADVFVLPSYTEGFPNSLVEAMAAGLPCITTPVGSIPDFVRDGENGILVPPRDAGAIANALRALHDPARREATGRAAFSLASTRFTPGHAAHELLALVQRDA